MKVFLDMDGVIVDFLKGLHKSLDAPYSYKDYLYEKGKWNMLTDIRGFNDIPVTFEQYNGCCTDVFWRNLEWIHDGHFILNAVTEKFGANNIYLLTTPMPNLGSWTGKARWVNKNLPYYSKRLIISTASKSLLAGSDTLLIDDKDENVDEFRAAGGRAILVPRPWNKLNSWADVSLQQVKQNLEGIR